MTEHPLHVHKIKQEYDRRQCPRKMSEMFADSHEGCQFTPLACVAGLPDRRRTLAPLDRPAMRAVRDSTRLPRAPTQLRQPLRPVEADLAEQFQRLHDGDVTGEENVSKNWPLTSLSAKDTSRNLGVTYVCAFGSRSPRPASQCAESFACPIPAPRVGAKCK